MSQPDPTPSDGLKAWIVLRYDLPRMVWEEVACTNARTAGDAFRTIVLSDAAPHKPPLLGEYRVLTLEDSAHIAVELNLKDLQMDAAR